jgi:DNA polymerase-3 subunit chi
MKVEFYILDATSRQQAMHFACGLIEKSYANQQAIYVHLASKDEAERMDTLLWTYQEDSFLPHLLFTQTSDEAPILIGYRDAPSSNKQVLINLSDNMPVFYSEFAHVIEIVFSDPTVQQLARDRFRQYRESGCELHTYKINASERRQPS